MSNGKSASPPFATAGGKPVAPSSGASGAHDFVKDPRGSATASGGGFDVTKQNRLQAEADPLGAGNPNSQEIPAGGKTLFADPGPVSKTVSGSAPGPTPAKPFKSLK